MAPPYLCWMWIALKNTETKSAVLKGDARKLPPGLAQALAAGRLSHAVLIAGPETAGRTAARLAAKALLCPERQGASACGHCRSCTTFEAGTNPDFVSVEADKSIKVDQVRTLREAARLHAMGEAGIAVVLEEADLMTPQAQNALLKLLEEPPDYVYILLAAPAHFKLLSTVVSRVFLLSLGEAGEEALDKEHEEKIQAIAQKLAQALAGGTPYARLEAIAPLEGDKDLVREVLPAVRKHLHAMLVKDFANAQRYLALIEGVRGLEEALNRNANLNLLVTQLAAL